MTTTGHLQGGHHLFHHHQIADFDKLPAVKLLQYDRRPVFVVDLGSHHAAHPDQTAQVNSVNGHKKVEPIYINPALQGLPLLCNTIKGVNVVTIEQRQVHEDFAKWTKHIGEDLLGFSVFQYGDVEWAAITIDGRWRIIDGTMLRRSSHGSDFSRTASMTSAEYRDVQGDCPFGDIDLATLGDKIYKTSKLFLNAQRKIAEDGRHLLSLKRPRNHIKRIPTEIKQDKSNIELWTKLADLEAAGIYVINGDGRLHFGSETWYQITDHSKDDVAPLAWMNIFENDEIPNIQDVWHRVTTDQEPVKFEAKLKKRWKPPAFPDGSVDPIDMPVTVCAIAYPDEDQDGKVIGCSGIMRDITERAWREHLKEQQLSAAIERAECLEQLHARSRDVALSESRFRKLADFMPFAISLCDKDGEILYANNTYYEMLGLERDKLDNMPWLSAIPAEDLPTIISHFTRLSVDLVPISCEARLKRPPRPEDEKSDAYSDGFLYIIVSAWPELDDSGQLKYITGCLTDVTKIKWAEQQQGMRAADALEAKHKLEQFIDMTSHEMRNPLGAIVHSAEEIVSMMATARDMAETGSASKAWTNDTVDNTIDAAKTIMHCADHSTRIVDDILTISKLESGLVQMSPSTVYPIDSVRKTINMFDWEMRTADIKRNFIVDTSFDTLCIDRVIFDANRLSQILINLITNSIKFTRPERERRIDICMKASIDPPSFDSIEYLPRSPEHDNDKALDTELNSSVTPPLSKTNTPDDSDIIYIQISVADTGCGVKEEEQNKLFERFSQAKKRTHVQYGGSGLGLYISRQLCEMQGGQIGMKSTPDCGSTFVFYIKAIRVATEQPENNHSQDLDMSSSSLPDTSYLHPQSADTTTRPHIMKRQSETNVNQHTPPPGEAEPHPSLLNTTILLVEDNVINQKVMVKQLSKQGFCVKVANHGQEALEHIKRSKIHCDYRASIPIPHPIPYEDIERDGNAGKTMKEDSDDISLILLDLEMPIMDGMECIREIRRLEQAGELLVHVPVIAVTANARMEQIEAAISAGMDDFITKPFRMHKLYPLMERVIKSSRSSACAMNGDDDRAAIDRMAEKLDSTV